MTKKIVLSVTSLLFVLLSLSCGPQREQDAKAAHFSRGESPRRIILFIIDGFAVGTPENMSFEMNNFRRLMGRGTYYMASRTILPAHPKENNNPADMDYYPWTCSLPNPTAMSGSVFIGKDDIKNELIQHCFRRAGLKTAFTVNCGAYEAIAHDYDVYHQLQETFEDLFKNEMPAEDAKKIIEEHDPHFLRVHMQGPGSAGHTDRDEGRTIWQANSFYKKQVEQCDRLLGDFVAWLDDRGMMEDTVLFVTGDNGQYAGGAHPPYEPAANKIPMLVLGRGIRQGRSFAYAEHSDIVETVCYLMKIDKPACSEGRVLWEALKNSPSRLPGQSKYLDRLNTVLINHHKMISETPKACGDPDFAVLNRQFEVLERIGTWHKRHSSLRELVRHQESIYNRLLDKAQTFGCPLQKIRAESYN